MLKLPIEFVLVLKRKVFNFLHFNFNYQNFFLIFKHVDNSHLNANKLEESTTETKVCVPSLKHDFSQVSNTGGNAEEKSVDPNDWAKRNQGRSTYFLSFYFLKEKEFISMNFRKSNRSDCEIHRRRCK